MQLWGERPTTEVTYTVPACGLQDKSSGNLLFLWYASGMAKATRTITIDPEILAAVEAYAKVVRENTNVVIQQAVRELLERNGRWPAKTKATK